MNIQKMVLAQYVDLGATDYMQTLGLQQAIAGKIKTALPETFPDTILLTEHRPCIVFGGSDAWNTFSDEFLADLGSRTPEEALRGMGISFYQFRFGGGASYIGPDQLIVYPINRYTRLIKPLDLTSYKNLIDRTMLQVMRAFGIEEAYIAEGFSEKTQRERRDIWVDIDGRSYKIGAKGIHIEGDVAFHGFQLYINREGLKHFGLINPCGYRHDEVSVISMEDIVGHPLDVRDVKVEVLAAIRKNFGYEEIMETNVSTLLSELGPDLQGTL